MRPGAAASCRGAPSGRARRPPAAQAAAAAERPGALPPKAVPAFSRFDQWPEPTLVAHLAAGSEQEGHGAVRGRSGSRSGASVRTPVRRRPGQLMPGGPPRGPARRAPAPGARCGFGRPLRADRPAFKTYRNYSPGRAGIRAATSGGAVGRRKEERPPGTSTEPGQAAAAERCTRTFAGSRAPWSAYATVMTTLPRACPCSTRRRPSAVPASG